MSLPLSKICHIAGDAAALAQAYAVIDASPTVLEGQNPIRRWEYAMALRAILAWRLISPWPVESDPLRIGDVGGADSNFWQVLQVLARGAGSVVIIDPRLEGVPPVGLGYVPGTLEQLAAVTATPGARFDILTCLSVIEHLPAGGIQGFLEAAYALLRPGGLFVLTTDFWGTEGPDTAHFHWMRERIYTPDTIRALVQLATSLGFQLLEPPDWTYHGNQVYDYSIASLVLVKP